MNLFFIKSLIPSFNKSFARDSNAPLSPKTNPPIFTSKSMLCLGGSVNTIRGIINLLVSFVYQETPTFTSKLKEFTSPSACFVKGKIKLLIYKL